MNIETTLAQREASYGDYEVQSSCAQRFKILAAATPNWEELSMAQREALDLIFTKIARILHGDPDHMDSWRDIIGYTQLIVRTLERQEASSPTP